MPDDRINLDDVEVSLIPMLCASYFNNDPAVGKDITIDDRIIQLCLKVTEEIRKRNDERKQNG